MARMGASSNQDYARRGLVVLLVAAAVVAYMALDPGWPFLASVLIFVAVVPALVWLAAGAIYPKGDSDPAVPIDRGSGNGFAIYLDAEPTGEMQGPTEMFLMINGGSLRSIERAGLTAGSPVFVHVEESEARKILDEMVEFGIRAHMEREVS
jgi:hypothetical protein